MQHAWMSLVNFLGGEKGRKEIRFWIVSVGFGFLTLEISQSITGNKQRTKRERKGKSLCPTSQ